MTELNQGWISLNPCYSGICSVSICEAFLNRAEFRS